MKSNPWTQTRDWAQEACQANLVQWKGINRKQSTRWQHLCRLKTSAFFSLQIFFSCYETQQLILGTGAAIWWLTEPHYPDHGGQRKPFATLKPRPNVIKPFTAVNYEFSS
jgi:hypothetical protein